MNADGPTTNARLILERARATVDAFDKAFATVRSARGVTSGAPTDAEQDLLRAALVLAGAGLDSLTKQLLREAVPVLLGDEAVQRGLEEFTAARIKSEAVGGTLLSGPKFLARLLAAGSTRSELIALYTDALTAGSLQSVDEFFRASAALGVEPKLLGTPPNQLKPIFEARNQIIHELDIDLQGKKRKRRQRTRDGMLSDARCLLDVGEALITNVEAKLTGAA